MNRYFVVSILAALTFGLPMGSTAHAAAWCFPIAFCPPPICPLCSYWQPNGIALEHAAVNTGETLASLVAGIGDVRDINVDRVRPHAGPLAGPIVTTGSISLEW